jgi:hypothetical protein
MFYIFFESRVIGRHGRRNVEDVGKAPKFYFEATTTPKKTS